MYVTIMQPSDSIFKSVINVKWKKNKQTNSKTPSKVVRVKEGTVPNLQILYLSDFPQFPYFKSRVNYVER